MNTAINIGDQLEQWLADEIPPGLLLTPLSDSIAHEVIAHLKDEADRYWGIDPSYSLKYADRIIAIGQAREDSRQTALGLMAKGDTLKFLGRTDEAWEMLEQAGNMFETVGDEVGWARTRIGRLYLSLELNRVADTLADVELARTILFNYGEQEKLTRLEINTAYVFTYLGDQHQALRLYHSALSTAEALGDAGQQHLGLLHMNIGFAHEALGDFPQALVEYEKARDLFSARNETRNIANIELNIAYIAQAQGHYQHALRVLYGILERGIDQFPLEERTVKHDLVECFLCLNRYSEARELAQKVIADYRSTNTIYDMSRMLLHLATAEAELGNYTAAQLALDEANSLFTSLGAKTWSMIARLQHGQIALKQGDFTTAYQDALATATYFKSEGQLASFATASLLIGHTSLASENFVSAVSSGANALQISKRFNVPSLRYTAHLLLGRVAEAQSKNTRAIHHYQAATATVERVQRRLTITLRPGFLENKDEAWKSQIGLYLRMGKTKNAFEALERAKSGVLLSYLANRERLRWEQNDPESQELIDELDLLRGEHQWYYRLAHFPPRDPEYPSAVQPEQALNEVAMRERRMRAITEHLYLRGSMGSAINPAPVASLQDIQDTLEAGTKMIEYYNDGIYFWAFILDKNTFSAQRLSITTEMLNHLLAQLNLNLAAALEANVHSSSILKLTKFGQHILHRLYSLLIEPISHQLIGIKQLMIVPYGALHYLPFHLLYDGSTYLVEEFETVILPTASLTIRPGLKRSPGALILAHSWKNSLPHTQTEAQIVKQLFGGKLYSENSASRTVLQTPPTQILHVATHGHHRLDQPDLSYLELADGQLFADDLLQEDLSYELVTLSACETGRGNIAADEELIGIGRGLLYAGAGALILSLWHVADESTLTLMKQLYSALKAGSSKSAALRQAQLSFLARDRNLHPALWGAFQLVGDPRPLSTMY